MDFDPRDYDSRDDDRNGGDRDHGSRGGSDDNRDWDDWRQPGVVSRDRDDGDVREPGRGPGDLRQSEKDGHDPRDETRWPERNRDERTRDTDPGDAFTRHLNLPRGLERELVRDRDHQYTLRGSESRTLATVGAFRVVSSRDLRDYNGRPCDPRSGDPIVLQPGYTITRVASGAVGLDGLVVGKDGWIYVTDYAAGTLLRTAGKRQTGSFELLATGLPNPTDVVRTPDGRLFVTASATGQLLEIRPEGVSVFANGFPNATSIDHFNGNLIVTNSSVGTITSISLTTGTTRTIRSGLYFPYGATVAADGTLDFINFGSGELLRSDVDGAPPAFLSTGTPFGIQFTTHSVTGQMFVSDPVTATVYSLDGGILVPFATGFIGKGNLPIIGPTGIGFRGPSLFVADGPDLWRIDPPKPQAASLWWLGAGAVAVVLARPRRLRRKKPI